MNLSAGLSQLYSALKDARARLDETRVGWSDGVRHEFDEAYWVPLDTLVTTTLRRMEHLSQVLTQARQETE